MRIFTTAASRIWSATKREFNKWSDGVADEIFWGPNLWGAGIGYLVGTGAGAYYVSQKDTTPGDVALGGVLGGVWGTCMGASPHLLLPLCIAAATASQLR
jgi:hypothetical protein